MARFLVIAVAVLALAACGSEEEAGGPTGSAPEPTPTATTTAPETDPEPVDEYHVKAYFLRGETVAPAGRTGPDTEAVARAAVEELLAGPTAQERGYGLTTSIPAGTELLDIALADGIVTVDLSRAFESGGGTLSMTTRLAQLVFTLTQFASVDGVELRLDGEPVESIGGEGVEVKRPMRRTDFEEATPVILVEFPAIGDTITNPVAVRGSAMVFEATVLVTLTDGEGRILAEDVATATEGAPSRGEFRISLPFDPPPSAQLGVITVASPNAAGGPPLHAFEVPVRLEP